MRIAQLAPLYERVPPVGYGGTERVVHARPDLGDVVLDPFLGSGSTLIACEQHRRRCYGIEIDPAYVDVAVSRWEHFTGKKAKRRRARGS